MPNLNILVDASLLRAVNVESAKAGMTQRDWVIWVLSVNVGWQKPEKPEVVIERKKLSNSEALRAQRESQSR